MDANVARHRLQDEWERLLGAREAVTEERRCDATERSLGQLSTLDQHQADVASEVFEREKELSILEQVDADLDAVGEAFRRIDHDSYGRCDTCGVAIPDERLAARPTTRFCVEHERLWELRTMSLSFPEGEYRDATSAEQWAEREATRHFEFLPTEDMLPEFEVGPEEAALHTVEIDGEPAARMGADEIELAEFLESNSRDSA